eukprot:4422226-Lingulodinium_polyedra.AAC.1
MGRSRARRAPAWSRVPHQLRLQEFPFGLPDLGPRDREVLVVSNNMAERVGKFLQVARQRG